MDSGILFNDFRLVGCWNWLLDSKEVGDYEELFLRYNAWKKLGIRQSETFEETPARLLESLLLLDTELNKAQERKAKDAHAKS